jgi:hypothetical protein
MKDVEMLDRKPSSGATDARLALVAPLPHSLTDAFDGAIIPPTLMTTSRMIAAGAPVDVQLMISRPWWKKGMSSPSGDSLNGLR